MTDRRTFTKSLGAAAGLAAAASAATGTAGIQVAVVTQTDGPHIQAYLEALRDMREVDSVVIAASGKQIQELAQPILGRKLSAVYDSWSPIFVASSPTMALVSLEAHQAPSAIRAALNAGCHVLAEKPACVRVEDFRELAELADQKQRHLMLALANRLNPEIVAARALIETGKIGKVYGVEMHLVADQLRLTRPAYQQSWYASKERAGGGHLSWLGIHWLDLAMHLTQASIVELNAMIANVGGQPIDVEDSAVLACRFDNGSLGTFTSGYYLDSGYHSHIKIWGSLGWLEIQAHGDMALRWYSQSDKAAGEQSMQHIEQTKGYTPWVHACVRAAMGSEPAPMSTADSLRVLETVFAAYRAAESGCRQVLHQ